MIQLTPDEAMLIRFALRRVMEVDGVVDMIDDPQGVHLDPHPTVRALHDRIRPDEGRG